MFPESVLYERLITTVFSLMLYGVIPGTPMIVGIPLATTAICLMAE